jgi:DNA (cytosine-5)-methyltransferase 1
MKRLCVATDCSGIEAPIQALDLLKVPFDHIWSSEIDPMAQKSIQGNYHPQTLYTDIFKRNHKKLPNIDFYVAGFPCQTFSTLGKREGFFDEQQRGIIFFECYKTIQQSKPKVFILENVKGLLNHDHGKTFEMIMLYLNKLKGYKIYHKVLNTRDYGLPQNRERIYIVGIKTPHDTFEFPLPFPLKKTITSILEKKPTNPKLQELTPHKINLLHELLQHGKIDSLKEPWLVNLNVSNYTRTGARKNICPCLLAGEGGNCIYYLTSIKRRLSPREYLRLQGFPDSFKQCVSDRFIYKQAGNSMSVNVLYHLIKQILNVVKI